MRNVAFNVVLLVRSNADNRLQIGASLTHRL